MAANGIGRKPLGSLHSRACEPQLPRDPHQRDSVVFLSRLLHDKLPWKRRRALNLAYLVTRDIYGRRRCSVTTITVEGS